MPFCPSLLQGGVACGKIEGADPPALAKRVQEFANERVVDKAEGAGAEGMKPELKARLRKLIRWGVTEQQCCTCIVLSRPDRSTVGLCRGMIYDRVIWEQMLSLFFYAKNEMEKKGGGSTCKKGYVVGRPNSVASQPLLRPTNAKRVHVTSNKASPANISTHHIIPIACLSTFTVTRSLQFTLTTMYQFLLFHVLPDVTPDLQYS